MECRFTLESASGGIYEAVDVGRPVRCPGWFRIYREYRQECTAFCGDDPWTKCDL